MGEVRLRDMFREYRKSKNLSFRQMETLTGIEYTALHRFEQGIALDEAAFSAIVKWLMSKHEPESDVARVRNRKWKGFPVA